MYLQDYFSGKDEAHHLMAQARDCFLPHFKGNEWTPAGFDAVTKEPTQWSIQLTQPAGRKQPKYMVHLEDAKIVVREIEATGETGKRLMISVKLADEGEERIIRYCSTATAENGLKPSDDLGIGWFVSHSLIQGRWPESNPANMLKAFSFRKQYSAVLSERVFRNYIIQTLPDVIDPDLACDMQEFIDRDLSDVLSKDFRRDYEAYEHLNYLTDDDQPDWEQKYLVYIPDEFECQLLTAIALHLEAWLSVLFTSLHGFDFDGEMLTKMHYEYILGVDCVAKLINAELPKEVAGEIKEINQLMADAGYWQQRAQVEGIAVPNIKWRTIENSDGAVCTNESGSIKVSVNDDFTVHLAINGAELDWAGMHTPDGFHVREGHWNSDNSIPNLVNLKEHPELIRQSFKFGTNEHKSLGIALSFLHWASNQNERTNNNTQAQQNELAEIKEINQLTFGVDLVQMETEADAQRLGEVARKFTKQVELWKSRAEAAEIKLKTEQGIIKNSQQAVDRSHRLVAEAIDLAKEYQQRAEAAETQLKIEQEMIESLQKEIDHQKQMRDSLERSYSAEVQCRKDINGQASYLRNLADDALQSLSRVSVDAKQLQVVMLWSAGEINTRRACLTLGMTEKELGRLKANLITSALGNVFHPMRPIYNWSHPEIPAEATHLTGELNGRGKIETVWAWKAGDDGLSFRSGQWVGGIKLQVIHAYGNSILTDESYQFVFNPI